MSWCQAYSYPCLLKNSYVTATTKLGGKMSLINKLMIQVYQIFYDFFIFLFILFTTVGENCTAV